MINRILLSLCCCLCCLACGSEEIDLQAVIEARKAERLAGFRANIQNECREKVITAALARADSLLLARARRLRQIAGRPPKPRRPGEPPLKELSSELPLRPLFPFEIRFDTLLRDSLYQDSIRLDSIMLLQLDSLRLDSVQRGLLPPLDTLR